MKKTAISILILFCTSICFGQVDSAVNQVITQRINAFGATLDSVIVKTKTSSTAITAIDTLTISAGSVITFFINLTVENTSNSDAGGSTKIIQIKNLNGVYSIVSNTDIAKFASQGTLSTFTWAVTIPAKSAPIIQVTGKALPLKFTICRSQNVIPL